MTTSRTHKTITAATLAVTIALAVPQVSKFEGVWLIAKPDTLAYGIPTVCYGETEGVKVGDHYTPQQCADMLAKKLPRYLDEINACISVDISPRTRASLLSMSYNIGTHALCGSTTMRKLNAGDAVGACDAMMSWTKAGGKFRQGLANRRTAERKDCLQGVEEFKQASTPKVRATEAKPACAWWRKCS